MPAIAAVSGASPADQSMAQPIAGINYELDAIAATVIGGTSLLGGQGSVVGTLIGVIADASASEDDLDRFIRDFRPPDTGDTAASAAVPPFAVKVTEAILSPLIKPVVLNSVWRSPKTRAVPAALVRSFARSVAGFG